MDFKGKVAIVTGGGSGIGRACAKVFAERNAAVALLDRDKTKGEAVARELSSGGGKAAFFAADVSLAEEIENVVRQVMAEFGRIDILVSNAGIQRYGTVTTISEEQWDEVMNVNLKGAFLMAKHTIPRMIESGGGSIVFVGSVQSVAAQRNSVQYVVSKHGLLGLTRCIALDYGQQNIRANCVLPGAIDTPMLRWSAGLDQDPERVLEACDTLHIRGKMGRPEEVANAIAFLANDLASFITGSALPVDGGLLVPIGGMAFQKSGTGGAKDVAEGP